MLLVFHAKTSGLGNRLRALAGYQALAQLRNVPFALCWEPTPACGALFQDLFVPSGIALLSRSQLKRCRNDNSVQVYSAPDWFTYIFKKHAPASAENEFLQASVLNLRALRPTDKIRERLDRFTNACDLGSCLGLHVRLTDNVRSYEGFKKFPYFDIAAVSQEEGFHYLVTRAFGNGSVDGLFLATDSLDFERRFRNKSSVPVHTFPKHWRSGAGWLRWLLSPRLMLKYLLRERIVRASPIEEAVIEMFLLAKCKILGGTYFSSFSKIAALLGEADYYEICGQEPRRCRLVQHIRQAMTARESGAGERQCSSEVL